MGAGAEIPGVRSEVLTRKSSGETGGKIGNLQKITAAPIGSARPNS
jgi:hypothetical protein